MSESVTGYIDHIIFRNEDNGYTVLVLKGTEGDDEELTCVGTFPVISQGATIEASGNFINHHIYGKQFQITSFTEKMPEDAMAMERYLGSGAIKGIGAALAARIVRRFGADTLRIVEEEPERLAEIKGISEKKAREIAAQMEEKADMRKAMMFLQKYGISLNLGAKIYQKYGDSVYSVLQENPYRLADDISGVGFKIADEIAGRIGIHTDSDYRIKSGMMYTLLQATGEGHVYLPKEELFQRSSELLGVDVSYMEKHLMDLSMERKVIQKEEGETVLVYPSRFYYLELNTARMLSELNIDCPEDEAFVQRRIAQIEKETGTTLDEMQKKAVTEAAGHGLFILTGGPGTGKTTTINAIIRFFEGEGSELRLAAPTGRAAKRMTEATGYEAQTIHRLLELNGMPEEERQGQAVHFERNAENPLEADVIIIDEMSMVDIQLMHSLLLAVTAGTRLILVGDENQLPACKGNWYDHIRLPSHNVFSCVFTDCIRIIIPVFPAAIIFVSHKRLPKLSIINKNRSSLIKAAAKRRAFPAVFFLLFYRLSAFQTIILSDPAKYSFTLRTDQRFLIFQYSVTHRAVPRIKDIEKHIYIFIQKQSFLPDEKGIYSSSFNLISREL
jgi:exodeoxyribonuclease V alpha subunit